MPYKVDFHTHSTASPDGALTPAQYRRMIEREGLHCIAVTDHNTIEMAQKLRQEFGQKIIVGEEITTTKGEIVGLYLTKIVPAMLTPAETIRQIHAQGGLVYIPHPFETARKGIQAADLEPLMAQVDIIETNNGRAVFQNRKNQAAAWAQKYGVAGASSSDAHGVAGWGRTYTLLEMMPTRDNLLTLLQDASYVRGLPGVRGVLYPKFNRLRRRMAW